MTVERVIRGRARSAEFPVTRLLPAAERRMVGPFIFLDHMGPTEVPAGGGLDVRPHPHVGLATVTWLFEGALVHRDSLGYQQVIRPGELNWMVAGRGIVHSERSPDEDRAGGGALHGVQLWVALPDDQEDADPSFTHYPASAVPTVAQPGVRLRVIAGEAFGVRGATAGQSPLFYAEAHAEAGAEVTLPAAYPERAAYLVSGRIRVEGTVYDPETLVVFGEGATAAFTAVEPACVMLLGGEPVGPRLIEWNFVATTAERLAAAKAEWRRRDPAGPFPLVPGDAVEFIPLPDVPAGRR